MNTTKTAETPDREVICNMCKLDTVACKYARMTGKCECPHACEFQKPIYK